MLFLPGILLVLVGTSPAPLFAEPHYAEPGRNCRISESIPLPLHRVKQQKAPPAWGGWQLRLGDALVFVEGDKLARFSLAAGTLTAISEGVTLDKQVQAALGPSGLYALTAARVGASAPSPFALAAYSTGTFQPLWSVQPFPEAMLPMLAIPLASADKVIVGAGNKVSVRAASDGRELWQAEIGFALGAYPALEDDILVLPNSHGIDAYHLDAGTLAWQRAMDPAAFNPSRSVSIEAGTVYAPLSDTSVGALDLQTGRLLWESAPLPAPVDFRHPLIAGAEGIFVPLNGGLARLASDGSLAWFKSYAFLRERQLSPALLATSNVVFLGGADGIYAASPASGDVLWSELGLGQVADIEFSGTRIVVVNLAGDVFTFAP